MKKVFLLVFLLVVLFGSVFSGTIKVNSPNGGEKWKLGSVQKIQWTSSGLTNKVKLTLWKNNSLVGLIIKDMPQTGGYSWKVGSFKGGSAGTASVYKIKIREQGGSSFQNEDISDFFFSIIPSSENPNETKLLIPENRINTMIQVKPEFRIKSNNLVLENIFPPSGKLSSSKNPVNFGSSVVLKMDFKNATKVRLRNIDTGEQLYLWTGRKPESRVETKKVVMWSTEYKFEMEVAGPKSANYTEYKVLALPIVNKFAIIKTGHILNFDYSFSGCEYAYLKKFDTNTNSWVRVAKLSGAVYMRKGDYPRKGSLRLTMGSTKKTKYYLALIGDNGVVDSKIVQNVWVNKKIN